MGICMVTGASTGIGRATAVRLAADHELVWAAARNPDAASELHDAVAVAGIGDRVRTVTLDVDDDASVAEAFDRVVAESGPIDVLVNNAGISGSGTIEDTPLEEFRRQMETNVFGVLRCTKAVVPSMRQRGAGTIVNVSSLAGRVVRAAMGAYGATKFAVEALSESLAQELAPFGVRVAIIEPGVIATPIWVKSAPPPADSAYAEAGRATMTYFTRMLSEPTPPEAVADTIAEAVSTTSPKLRYPVGWDAVQLIERRRHVADEDLVAMSALGHDEWAAAFGEAFGIDLI